MCRSERETNDGASERATEGEEGLRLVEVGVQDGELEQIQEFPRPALSAGGACFLASQTVRRPSIPFSGGSQVAEGS